MVIQSEQDIEQLWTLVMVLAKTIAVMRQAAEPGMTTLELDAIGRAMLDQHGARSAPELTYDFPGATCISVNEEVAHGVPGNRVLAASDVVNVDVSAELDGFFADSGATFVLPPSNYRIDQLCAATKMALSRATAAAVAGAHFNDIGRAISGTAKEHKFHVIRNLCSHGVGRGLHEDPEFIFPFEHPTERRRLRAGQVITIEPFLSNRPRRGSEAADGWTLRAGTGVRTAQYEHTMVITDSAPILTTVL